MLDKKDFCKQIIVVDGMATYTFSVIFGDHSLGIKLSYLDTDDFTWSAYEKSAIDRNEIDIPQQALEKAKSELADRIKFS